MAEKMETSAAENRGMEEFFKGSDFAQRLIRIEVADGAAGGGSRTERIG